MHDRIEDKDTCKDVSECGQGSEVVETEIGQRVVQTLLQSMTLQSLKKS